MKKYIMIIFIATIFVATAFAQETEIFIPAESHTSIYQLYQEGGVIFMSLITLSLVGVLLAAWKMPSCVKEFGNIALALGFISIAMGLRQAFTSLQQAPDVSAVVIYGSAKVALIAPIWSCIVYIIYLIIRIIQKPKTI